jgi:hypothetical protein
MGDIGTPITETIPAVGTSGTTYATNINLFLTEVKNRLEAAVPRASLEDGDLDLNGYDIQNALTVGFSAQGSTPSTPTGTLQMYGGELYWVGTGGVVQLTDGATLNSAAVGGITGDYGSPNPAEFKFVDLDQTYYAYDNEPTGAWAKLFARNFDLAAGNTGTTRLRLNFDGAGSYTLNFPDEAPASTTVVTMDSAGHLHAAERTVTVSVSTMAWKRDESVELVDSDGFKNDAFGRWTGPDATSPLTSSLHIPIVVPLGVTITGYTLYYNKATTSAQTIDAALLSCTNSGTATVNSSTINGNSPGATTLPVTGLSITPAAGTSYSFRLAYTAATDASTDLFTGFEFTYTTRN